MLHNFNKQAHNMYNYDRADLDLLCKGAWHHKTKETTTTSATQSDNPQTVKETNFAIQTTKKHTSTSSVSVVDVRHAALQAQGQRHPRLRHAGPGGAWVAPQPV
jgi:hypothetical protein